MPGVYTWEDKSYWTFTAQWLKLRQEMAFLSRGGADPARPRLRPRRVGERFFNRSPRNLAQAAAGATEAAPQVTTTEITGAGKFKVDEVKGEEGLCTLVLLGELDTRSVPTLEVAISRCCAGGARGITLDLSGLTFIDSSGLWTITSARRWCERQAYGFSLIPGPESVQRVFDITGLSDVLPFRKDAGTPMVLGPRPRDS
jgi:anti-sigma B factor antagonist